VIEMTTSQGRGKVGRKLACLGNAGKPGLQGYDVSDRMNGGLFAFPDDGSGRVRFGGQCPDHKAGKAEQHDEMGHDGALAPFPAATV
jgi:hypothetical protein